MSFTNSTTRDLEKRWNAIARRIAEGSATSDEQRNFDSIANELSRREKASGAGTETRGVVSEHDRGFENYLRRGDTSGLEL
jgi:hypothetical protein